MGPFILRTQNPWRALALFLTVVGVRFWLIERYGTPLPYWDQWDGIGALILKPWLEGHLSFAALIAPHNEHRIFLTRVWSLGIFASNGQWDELLEMAVNAVFCGFSAVCVAGMLISELGTSRARTVFLAVGVYFVLPFGWENTLCGFQSQNYFLILFSLVAIWGLGFRRSGSGGWWVGLMGLVLACLSMATGFLAAVAAALAMTVRMAAERRRPGGGEVVTLSICVVAVAVGWFTRTEVPAHAFLRAESFQAFFWAALRYGAWPAYRFPLCALLVYLPTGLLAWRRLRARIAPGPAQDGAEPHPGAGLVLAFGGWAVLQTLALAYGRGGHAAPPVCRYMDLLAVGPLMNFLAWTPLHHGVSRIWWRRLAAVGGAFWTVALIVGLWPETANDFTAWMPNYRHEMEQGERNTHGYVATGDFNRFLVGKPIHGLPYPDPARLAAFLDDPTLRPILPFDIRLPLKPEVVSSNEAAPAAFVPDGLPPAVAPLPETACWGSYTAAGAGAKGTLRSRFVSATGLPYLRFEFAGDLGGDGLSFALKDPAGHRQAAWRPVHPPGERWHADYLALPSRAFGLEAVDDSESRWFAFTAPVEVGFWSYWAGFALRRGDWLAGLGFLLATLVELFIWIAARRGVSGGK